jgi:hypothetical protein
MKQIILIMVLAMLTVAYAVPTYTNISDGDSWFSGNVGIGTSTPSAKLHVLMGRLDLPGATSGELSGGVHFNLSSDGKNYIRGETIIADTGGNVGIGTSNIVRNFTVDNVN